VAADASGVYATFDAYTAPGVTDAVLRKFDPQGNALWTVKIERASDDSFNDVAATGDGVYATGWAQEPLPGQSSGGIFVKRYDGAGNLCGRGSPTTARGSGSCSAPVGRGRTRPGCT
jgi:hypothetical protein